MLAAMKLSPAYLDQTEAGVAAILQAANAELDVGQIEPVRQLSLEALVSHRHDRQSRLAQHLRPSIKVYRDNRRARIAPTVPSCYPFAPGRTRE